EREKFVELYSGENSRFIKDEFIFDKAVDKLMENVVFVEPEIEKEEVEEVKEETNTEEE
ncbi:MAG: trigger factor, partial [Tissierellia bacterium]|nr:trigger factor [Tissierellia bacterium]